MTDPEPPEASNSPASSEPAEPPEPADSSETPGEPGAPTGRTAHRRRTISRRWPTLRQRRRFWFGAGVALGLVAGLALSLLVPTLRDRDALEPDPRPLVILSGHDDSLDGQRQQLVTAWNDLHPDHPAQIVELPPIADAQRAEMLARAGAENGAVDVYNLDVTWTAEFADAGYISSLDESRVPTAGFLPGPLSTCRYEGRLYALPWNTDVGLLYYRTDLLAQIGRSGPPQTWDDLVADAAQVRGRRADVAGYVGQLADYEGLTVTALEMIWGAGGEVADDDGHVLPGPGDITAVHTGLDRLRALAPDLPALDEAGSLQDFRAGHALFMRNWPVAYRSLGQGSRDGVALPFAVAPLPPGSAALGGQNLAVSSRTTRPNAARALIEFLTGERSEQLLFERGGLPATRDVVYTDPQVTAVFPFAAKLRDALADARRRPTVPHYAQFSASFRDMADAYLHGTDPLPEKEFRDRLEAALQGRPAPDR